MSLIVSEYWARVVPRIFVRHGGNSHDHAPHNLFNVTHFNLEANQTCLTVLLEIVYIDLSMYPVFY